MGSLFGIHWHGHWQNLDDDEKRERAQAALTDALRTMGVLTNDRWQDISAVKLAFAKQLKGRLGHGWRNGRGWLTFYRGDPDSTVKGEGRRLVGLHAQWLLLKRQHSLGASLHWGGGDGDDEVMVSIHIPGCGVYLSAEGLIPRWARPKNAGQGYASERELGVTWHNGTLWFKLWNDPDEWSSKAPIWDARSKWRQPSIDPLDVLFGSTKCRTEQLQEVETVVSLPEGDYPATATTERRTWTRPRLPFWKSERISTEVTPLVPLPIPGKGENAWDCDDDAIHSAGSSEPTAIGAVTDLARRVLETRRQYGGESWVPDAGWPVLEG